MPFQNRADAGRQLAKLLQLYKRQRPVVLALPRGGVPVAAEVSAALAAPLDLVIARKIGLPEQPELAMGAVAEGAGSAVVRNEDVIALVGITDAEFEAVRQREHQEIERRRRRYLGDRPAVALEGRTAIVIDDGIATGATMRAALLAARARNPKRLVLAVPVAPTTAIEDLSRDVDDVICLESHEPFGAIGLYYRDFRQVGDEEVIELLRVQGPPTRRSA